MERAAQTTLWIMIVSEHSSFGRVVVLNCGGCGAERVLRSAELFVC